MCYFYNVLVYDLETYLSEHDRSSFFPQVNMSSPICLMRPSSVIMMIYLFWKKSIAILHIANK